MNKAMLAAVAALTLLAPGVAQAQHKPDPTEAAAAAEKVRGVEDPRAFVAERYRAYQGGQAPEDPDFAYSDRLQALFEAYDAWTRQHDDLIGALSFDWWINAQDWILADVEVSEVAEGSDRRIVSARFTNDGRPDEIRFRFVRQSERWFLDEAVEGTGSGDGGWTLSDLLRMRPE